MVGSGGVLFVFLVATGATLWARPEKAADLASLANTATVALSALLTSLVAGQSCVERRETGEKIERVFAPKHYDDPAVL